MITSSLWLEPSPSPERPQHDTSRMDLKLHHKLSMSLQTWTANQHAQVASFASRRSDEQIISRARGRREAHGLQLLPSSAPHEKREPASISPQSWAAPAGRAVNIHLHLPRW
ncbi:hypothetical protein M758_4G034400 [Ceratodon purpureus]|nr:hypothetical protein M758_4G034400 [Ceratodon purpureus]